MIKNFEDFIEKYKPIKNKIDKNASYDGLMFETYKEELDFVVAQNPKKIWTIINGESETTWLIAGFHFVDRMGYIISKKEWTDANEDFAMDDYISIEKAQEMAVDFVENNISVHNFVADELRSFIESKLTDEEKTDKQINVNVAKYHVIDYIEDELAVDRDTFENEIHDWWWQQI
jgi:hypothetical protein